MSSSSASLRLSNSQASSDPPGIPLSPLGGGTNSSERSSADADAPPLPAPSKRDVRDDSPEEAAVDEHVNNPLVLQSVGAGRKTSSSSFALPSSSSRRASGGGSPPALAGPSVGATVTIPITSRRASAPATDVLSPSAPSPATGKRPPLGVTRRSLPASLHGGLAPLSYYSAFPVLDSSEQKKRRSLGEHSLSFRIRRLELIASGGKEAQSRGENRDKSDSPGKEVKVEMESGEQKQRAYVPFVRTLKGHTGFVLSVCYSPNGSVIASGSYDNTVKIWSTATGEVIKTLEGHTGGVLSVCFSSPDGSAIASGSEDETVKIWNPTTGEVIRTFEGHAAAVMSVRFSPDGSAIASGSADNTVKIWSPTTGEVIKTLEGHTGGVSSVCFSSPDGSAIASGSDDNTVIVWSTSTGEVMKTLKGHTDTVNSVCFSPDGSAIASGSADKTVKIWNPTTGEVMQTLEGHAFAVTSVCFSPDGSAIVSASLENRAIVWSTKTSAVVKTLKGHRSVVWSVCFSPDGEAMASGSFDDTVKVCSTNFMRSLAAGLFILDLKYVLAGVDELLLTKVPIDILQWEEYLDDTYDAPEDFCIRLTLLFNALWQTLEDNHAVAYKSENAKKNSAALQQSVKNFVEDVKQHRPRLLVELLQRLDEKQVQELANTRVMQILIKELAKGGVNRLYYFEVLLFAGLLVAFARTSYVLKFADSIEQVKDDSSSMSWVVCTFVLSSLFLCREIGQIVAMSRLSLYKAYFKDFFNYLDMGAFVSILVSTSLFFIRGPGEEYNAAASVAALFIWLKLLSTIKALSKLIATFVLMLRIILRDIASFVVVMAFVLIMFGHALFMMLGSADPDSESGFSTVYDTMKTLYISMVTGAYNPDDFPDSYTYTLSAVFLFIVVIVMLNVLIAIVSDSYDAAMVKSEELFWSARMGLVAELSTTFGWILNSTPATVIGTAVSDFAKSDVDESTLNNLIKRLGILWVDSKKNRVINGILICCLPVTFPAFLIFALCYFGIVLLLQTLAKQVTLSSDVELKLGVASSSGDEWSGRVLDIVRRINQHSTENTNQMTSKMANSMNQVKDDLNDLKVEMATMKELLTRLGGRDEK